MSTSGKLIFLHDQSREERTQGLILAGIFLVGVVLGFIVGINWPSHGVPYTAPRYLLLRTDARQECLWHAAEANDIGKGRRADYQRWLRSIVQYDRDLRMFEQRWGLGPQWQVMAREVC